VPVETSIAKQPREVSKQAPVETVPTAFKWNHGGHMNMDTHTGTKTYTRTHTHIHTHTHTQQHDTCYLSLTQTHMHTHTHTHIHTYIHTHRRARICDRRLQQLAGKDHDAPQRRQSA
jgi:hypothetical protein